MRCLTFVFLFGIAISQSEAQTPLYSHFKLFKVEDGLPQSFVSGLTQDQDGFLWIGTRDGLARYDGREFKVFRHDNNDSTSLSSNVIIDLYLDPQNLLWVTYVNNKIDCFDPRRLRLSGEKPPPELQELLSRYKVGKFFRDHSGKFWLNTNYKGVICFDPTTRKITEFNASNKQLASSNNLGSVENIQGRICVFTEKGIEISNTHGTKMEEFFSYNPVLHFKFIVGAYNRVACLPDGRLVLTETNRLILFEPAKKSFSSISIPRVPEKQDMIKYLINGADGRVYLDAAGGIYRLEKNSTITYLWQSPNSNAFRNDARSFLVDRSGVAWFGSNGTGLYQIDLNTVAFTNRLYSKNFVTDNLGILPGLAFEKMPVLFRDGKWAYSFRYCYDVSGNLFLSYAQAQSTPGTGQVYVYKNHSLAPLPDTGTSNLPVKGLCISSGELYAVDRLGTVRKWKTGGGLPQYTATLLHLNMQTGDVSDAEVIDKTILIAVEKDGLYKIENDHIVEHYVSKENDKKSLPTNQLTDMCKDPVNKKCVWIGTLGQGLMKWDIDKGLEKIYTTADGLPNNTIYGIVPDNQNNLWISTNKGICRFDLRAKTFYNFDVQNGLIANEFNRFHHFVFPDGRISFGGLEGYSVFDPASFSADNFQTPVAFTKLLINNSEAQLSADVNELLELKLPYDKNFLSFEFAGLQFSQPGKIQYRYMLNGFDKDWIDAGMHNLATYTRLPPGKYTLLVNASNTSGRWSPFIKQLNIRITPPFWATWWAYTFYALIIIVLLRVYWKYHVNHIRLQNKIELEQSKALHLQEVDEMKNRFFDNITHEFRTPLTLILTPIEKLSKDDSLSAPHRSVLSNAHRNAEQLLKLINQLLDISKIESGRMKLNLSTGELDNFIESCISRFWLQAKEKKLRLSFSNEGVRGHYNFDEEKWEKIIVNLLGNAIKFTPAGGEIFISLKSIPGTRPSQANIECSVADSGIGIAQEKLPRIFDRFYMADDSGTRSHSGTGIGLSLARELTQLMNGKIEVKSEYGIGTTFSVTIPVEKIVMTAKSKFITEENDVPVAGNKFELTQKEINDGPLLLIVEDNDELRSFITEGLSERWRVMEAADGKDALEIILKELPDIVVSDVMMPEMDGVELCSISKNDSRTQHISFILLTAKAAHQSKLTGLGAGADEYLTKPFHFDELELRIKNLAGQQERLRKHLQKELLPAEPLPKLPHVNNLFIQELYKYLDERLDDRDMNVETLALAMNMSRRTLNRKLKAILNISS
ncbi:MAG: ATP-binding protein, partial [Flavisolibacter sp.]